MEYIDCPSCGANKIRFTASKCDVCETAGRYETQISKSDSSILGVTKFKVGDRVVVINHNNQNFTTVPCWLCGGEKRVLTTDKVTSRVCPVCYGVGTCTSHGSPKFSIVYTSVVDAIHMTAVIDQNGASINTSYEIRNPEWDEEEFLSEEFLFATEAEAQAECDRLNQLSNEEA